MKDLKMSLSQKSFVLILSGMSLALPQSIFAQNHNPEFKVSNTFLGGEPYIFIGDDDEAVYPKRTPVELKYREEAPEGGRTGKTTLEWISGGNLVDSYDSEGDTSGVVDGGGSGETDGGDDGKWTWSGDAEQQNFDGKTIYLQGKTAAAAENAADTATLKASHDADPEEDAFEKEFTLLKVDLAVDADRNGEVSFAGTDATTENEPFRFWINDDDDGEASYSEEDGDSSTKDHETFGFLDTNAMTNVRDLEDFFRLWIDLPDSFVEALENENLKLGLKWANTTGSPAVNLFKAVENDGGTLYLTDTTIAESQIEGEFDNPLKSVDGDITVTTGSTFVLKKEVFEGVGTTRDSVFLICEGAGVGKGELQLVILDSDDNEIGTGPSVWMDLLNVKSMYERALASVSFSEPWSYAESGDLPSFTVTAATDSQGYTFSQPDDETEECLVFVHGWKMEAPDVEVFGETMFKRLWWQGYKGRFRVFRWPTYTGDYSFSDSEFMAWKCGAALKSYVEGNVSGASLPSGYTAKVAAHSLGNVVVGSALADGLSLDNYLMMQAAIPSGCFNTSDAVNGFAHPGSESSAFDAVPGIFALKTTFGQQENTDPSPDYTNPDLGYRGYIQNPDVLVITNFCNPSDFALTTGSFMFFGTNWITWQLSYKPRQRTLSGSGEINFEYAYFSTAAAGERLKLTRFTDSNHDTVDAERFVGDVHESMAQIARTRSLPAGADRQVGGPVSVTVNLDTEHGFTDSRSDHSGQFRRPIQTVYDLYGAITTALE